MSTPFPRTLSQDVIFLLDLIAHAIQYPQKKIGIAICLVGTQGCGKGTVWDCIERLLGDGNCFSTKKPERDIYGHFNSKMATAFYVRMTECTRKKLDSDELKAIFTDAKIDVNSKFSNVIEVYSYARFFIDTNSTDAINDKHGERRYFIVRCNEEMAGHGNDYFKPLHNEVINDDSVIRALYEYLKARKIKDSYHKDDIPVGEYARDLKDRNRSEMDKFIEKLVRKEDADVKTLHLTPDEFAKRYTQCYPGGAVSADGIMHRICDDIKLQKIPGVGREEQKRPQNLAWCPLCV